MPKYNLTLVQKICLAGILIPLVAIFQKVFAINYIPIIPFLRISFGGPALIIFASILLGPWFGLIVGAASDLIGFFIFDPKMMGAVPFFQITALYALLGFSSYYVFKLVHKLKNKKLLTIIELSTFSIFLLASTLFVELNDSIVLYGATYQFNIYTKIFTPIVLFILLSLLFIAIFFIDKSFKKRNVDISVFHISFSCFLLEVFVMLIFGTVMKVWAFSGTAFLTIFLSQLVVLFFNVPLNTFLISYIMNLTKKLLRGKESA